MLNQPQGQLINVQRPHQIQPPGQHRLVPGQVLQANQMQQGGQPVQIRIQGDPINIGHPQIVNMQGQRVQQAPMGQQLQQQPNMGMNMQQMRQQPQQQQQMMNQQGQSQNQMQGGQQQQQQIRGNINQNQQQMRMAPQHGQQQMRMQPGQQLNINGPPQRMGTPNMQQNQQQMRMGQAPQQQQQQQQQPQMRMQQHQMQQGQNMNAQQGQQGQQNQQQIMRGPSPQIRMQQQHQQQHQQQQQQHQQQQQQQHIQQEPQFQMQQNQQNMKQQMHQNQHNHMNNQQQQQQPQQMRMQDQMQQDQSGHMNGPQQHQQQQYQQQHVQHQQQHQQQQQHIQHQQQNVQQHQQHQGQNQQMQQGQPQQQMRQPQQHMQQQRAPQQMQFQNQQNVQQNVQQNHQQGHQQNMQQNHQQNHQQNIQQGHQVQNQQQQPMGQQQGLRGSMQNSPQPIRINPQPAPQMMQQGRPQVQQTRPMQNQMRPQQKIMQVQGQDHQMQQQPQQQQQMQMQQQPQQMQQVQQQPQHQQQHQNQNQQMQQSQQQQPLQQQQIQTVVIENGQTIRLNGDQAIINGQQFRLMQVDPQQQTVDLSQLRHVGTTVVSEPSQFTAQHMQNDGQQQQPQQQQQRPQLQQRNSTHQLIPITNIHTQQIGMNNRQPQMMQQQVPQQQMQQPQQAVSLPLKTPKPRNRGKKTTGDQQQQQQQNPPMQQQQQQQMHQQSNHQDYQQQNMQQQNMPQQNMQQQNMQQQNMQQQNVQQQNMQQQNMQQQNVQQQNVQPIQIIRPNGQQIMDSPGGMQNVSNQQIAQKGRQRPMAPPPITPINPKNNQNFNQPQPTMVRQGKHMVMVGGPPIEMPRQPPPGNVRNNQPLVKRVNGPQMNLPSTSSQPSTSQQAELTTIKDAIALHLKGERRMTPEYIEYVCAQLTRIQHEMEKADLSSDFRYNSVKKLLAAMKGEDFAKIEFPKKPPRPIRQPPKEGPLDDEPENETPEERQKRYDGYMEVLKNAYPIKQDNRKYPRIPDEVIRKEAEFYMKEDMKARANYLKENLDKIPEEKRTKAKIEYLGLNLIELQQKVRKEVAATLVFKPPTEFLINPWSIRRSKAEYNQELKQHPDRMALEKKRRMTNNALLQNLTKHYREFKDFHRSLLAKHTKIRKTLQTQFSNEAKKKTREEMKNEKIRIQKLILEDEDGYRAMLDEKKDQRLVYLLEQTDGYIESLCDLLKEQKSSGDSIRPIVQKDSNGLVSGAKAKSILAKARNEENDDEYANKKLNFDDYYTTAHAIREEITEQHHMMGGGSASLKLKPYQIKGLEWMVSLYNNNLNGILADEMGLGKTIQSISFITYLMEKKKNPGPYLVIVPLSTVPNWQNEFKKWAEDVQLIVYKGSKEHRKAVEPIIKSGKFNVLLTTFEYVIREKALLGKLRWKYMLIDEGHRLKNQHSKLTEMLNSRFQCPRRLLITGTPLQNNLPELWALLNFLLPSIFSSCNSFEQWFNAPFATTGEKVELTQEETMLIIRRLHKVLRPFLLRRLKKEVESELPDKQEFVVKCEMSALQKVLYKHMQKGLLLDGKQNTGSRSLMNSMVHLRKLCNHPFLFNNVEDSCHSYWDVKYITGTDLYRVSGKMELLDRILPKLQATGHRVLMFFQMTSMMTIVEDYLAVKTIQYLRLDGSTKPDERGGLLDKFNDPDSKYFLFMLSTRAGGLGLNLQTADTVIIFDSDWNPHQDMQAQDRAHRIGQKQEVRVFRLITANSVEEKILASAKFKLNVDEKVIQAGKFDNRSTGAERKEILEQIIKAENETEDDDDLPSDEDINAMLARNDEEFDIFQKMDQDRIEHDRFHGVKPRLVGDNEIPKDILRAADETEYQEKAKEEGRVAYMEVIPGSRRKRKDVNYSTDTMSDDKFLETLLDGEDPTAIRPEPEVIQLTPEKPPEPAQPSFTFKVPRLTIKLGEDPKKKHKHSESDSEKHRKRKLEEVQEPLQKLKIRFSGEPIEKIRKNDSSEETPEKKKRKRRDSEEGSSEKKKKHKHHKHDDIEESVKKTPSTSSEPEIQPLKLKLNVRFNQTDEVFAIPTRTAEELEKSEQKKKARENETEEERRARKAAKKERRRLEALEEEARLEAKRARKEQRRLEKERLEAAGSAFGSAAGSA